MRSTLITTVLARVEHGVAYDAELGVHAHLHDSRLPGVTITSASGDGQALDNPAGVLLGRIRAALAVDDEGRVVQDSGTAESMLEIADVSGAVVVTNQAVVVIGTNGFSLEFGPVDRTARQVLLGVVQLSEVAVVEVSRNARTSIRARLWCLDAPGVIDLELRARGEPGGFARRGVDIEHAVESLAGACVRSRLMMNGGAIEIQRLERALADARRDVADGASAITLCLSG